MSRKSDLRYWKKAIYREKYGNAETRNYSVKIQQSGRREKFSLGILNEEAAALKAREIYGYVQAHGMDEACAKYKPGSLRNAGPIVTVGDLVNGVLQITQNAQLRTVKDYCQRFRRIVAEIFDIQEENKTNYRKGGGLERWTSKVDAVKLRDIAPAAVERWKVAFINRAGNDPTAISSARTSVNSILRMASSLFADKRIKHLPQPVYNPFKEIALEPRQDMHYRSGFSIQELTEAALKELEQEQLKIYLLASMAGLRREEIDSLQWSAFKWEQGLLSIRRTPYFQPKSNHSMGDADLDAELLALFRGFRAQAKSDNDFVIVSNVRPRPGAAYFHYRCNAVMDKLIKWLKGKGVPGKPLHTLRREYGSQINARHGIYEASRALRHADINITAQHYVRNTKRIAPELGHLLKSPQDVVNVVEIDDRQAAHQAIHQTLSWGNVERLPGILARREGSDEHSRCCLTCALRFR